MKPAKSILPPLAGSPTRNTCIFTTSPRDRPMPLSCFSMEVRTPTVWVRVSPYACGVSLGAVVSATGGTAPLRKTRVLPAGTSTAAEMGNVLFGILCRTTSAAKPGVATRSSSGTRMTLFNMSHALLGRLGGMEGFDVLGLQGVGIGVAEMRADVVHDIGDLRIGQ